MTMTAKRKSSTPRKAAKVGANGKAISPPLAPAEDAQLRAPERYEIDETTNPDPEPAAPPVAPAIEHPYGDKQIFVFTPRNVRAGESKDPIVVPHITTLNADVEFFWEMDELDPMHQAFAYMKRAEIPRPIQRRVVRLPQVELARFLNDWFMGVIVPQGVGPPGES